MRAITVSLWALVVQSRAGVGAMPIIVCCMPCFMSGTGISKHVSTASHSCSGLLGAGREPTSRLPASREPAAHQPAAYHPAACQPAACQSTTWAASQPAAHKPAACTAC